MLHLVPRPAPFQQCLEHTISVKPATFRRRDEIDAFGNALTRIEFEHPHRRLEVVTKMEVNVHPRPKVFAAHTMPWERLCADLAYHGAWPTRENLEACRFRHESPYVRVKQEFTDYAAECFPAGRSILECADALMGKLYREMKYAKGETTVGTPLREVLKKRRGVPPAIGSGASHAWVAVYTPPFGWLEFDPTNNAWVGTDHVAVAWGRDFGDVSPLHGVILGGATHELSVSVSVEPITQW
jgi:transglutaminase-like putative cysteine protease